MYSIGYWLYNNLNFLVLFLFDILGFMGFSLLIFMLNLYFQSEKADVNGDEEKYTVDLVARASIKTGRVISILFIIKLVAIAFILILILNGRH